MRQFLRLLRDTLRQWRFLVLIVCWALSGQVISSVCSWLNQNQYLRCGMDSRTMGFVYILVSVINMLSVFSQRSIDRLGRLRSLMGVLALGRRPVSRWC